VTEPEINIDVYAPGISNSTVRIVRNVFILYVLMLWIDIHNSRSAGLEWIGVAKDGFDQKLNISGSIKSTYL